MKNKMFQYGFDSAYAALKNGVEIALVKERANWLGYHSCSSYRGSDSRSEAAGLLWATRKFEKNANAS